MQKIILAGKEVWYKFGDIRTTDSSGLLSLLVKKVFFIDVNVEKINNKPHIKEGGIFCSASDSQNIVVVAISKDTKVGIDIEFLKPRKEELLAYCATQDEVSLVLKSGLQEKLISTYVWSLKESVQKADEIIFPASAYTITEMSSVNATIVRDKNRWLVSYFLDKGYIISIVARSISQSLNGTEIIVACQFVF